MKSFLHSFFTADHLRVSVARLLRRTVSLPKLLAHNLFRHCFPLSDRCTLDFIPDLLAVQAETDASRGEQERLHRS